MYYSIIILILISLGIIMDYTCIIFTLFIYSIIMYAMYNNKLF